MVARIPVTTRCEGETLQEWTYQQLRRAILSGVFRPGVSVTMRGLAEELDVSLMPVREALRRLVAEHALTLLPNRRVTVPQMTPARFDELCATRIALECLAAERAMLAVDEKRLAQMQATDEAMNEALLSHDIAAAVSANYEFHSLLYTAAPSDVLFPLIENLWLQFGPFIHGVLDRVSDDFSAGNYPVDRHRETLSAIQSRDAFALRVAIEADIRDGISAVGREELRVAGDASQAKRQ